MVKVWDLGTKECVQTYKGAQEQVWSVDYNPDGSKIVAGMDDGSLCIH